MKRETSAPMARTAAAAAPIAHGSHAAKGGGGKLGGGVEGGVGGEEGGGGEGGEGGEGGAGGEGGEGGGGEDGGGGGGVEHPDHAPRGFSQALGSLTEAAGHSRWFLCPKLPEAPASSCSKQTSKGASLPSSPISDGTLPERRLAVRFIALSDAQSMPISVGIVPESRLSLRKSMWNG